MQHRQSLLMEGLLQELLCQDLQGHQKDILQPACRAAVEVAQPHSAHLALRLSVCFACSSLAWPYRRSNTDRPDFGADSANAALADPPAEKFTVKKSS